MTNKRQPNLLIRAGLAIAAVGLLSAFSYPLVQEGCERAGETTYREAQIQMLTQSISNYVACKPDVSWNVNTPTKRILSELARGLDLSFDGRLNSFLPCSATVDSLNQRYRIIYKGSGSFRVLAR
jgi:hypothetical protein